MRATADQRGHADNSQHPQPAPRALQPDKPFLLVSGGHNGIQHTPRLQKGHVRITNPLSLRHKPCGSFPPPISNLMHGRTGINGNPSVFSEPLWCNRRVGRWNLTSNPPVPASPPHFPDRRPFGTRSSPGWCWCRNPCPRGIAGPADTCCPHFQLQPVDCGI